jgi:hypothetical protein
MAWVSNRIILLLERGTSTRPSSLLTSAASVFAHFFHLSIMYMQSSSGPLQEDAIPFGAALGLLRLGH